MVRAFTVYITEVFTGWVLAKRKSTQVPSHHHGKQALVSAEQLNDHVWAIVFVVPYKGPTQTVSPSRHIPTVL